LFECLGIMHHFYLLLLWSVLIFLFYRFQLCLFFLLLFFQTWLVFYLLELLQYLHPR
jgi:hypothetical protein